MHPSQHEPALHKPPSKGWRTPEFKSSPDTDALSRDRLAEWPMQGRLNSVLQHSAEAGIRREWEGKGKLTQKISLKDHGQGRTYGNGAITNVRKANSEVAQ